MENHGSCNLFTESNLEKLLSQFVMSPKVTVHFTSKLKPHISFKLSKVWDFFLCTKILVTRFRASVFFHRNQNVASCASLSSLQKN